MTPSLDIQLPHSAAHTHTHTHTHTHPTSPQDVMTSYTASMRDATRCQESLVEKWFQLLVKTKLTFLGIEDAYFHTVCEPQSTTHV